MKKRKTDAAEQAVFCRELMNRLCERVCRAAVDTDEDHIFGYTSMQDDIIRLRRELKDLSDKIRPGYLL